MERILKFNLKQLQSAAVQSEICELEDVKNLSELVLREKLIQEILENKNKNKKLNSSGNQNPEINKNENAFEKLKEYLQLFVYKIE